ncbi:hypothetical protein CR512_18450 [Pseudomonas putida]|nr:hypothetical protein CR512_18450 [Pseudomonas putida]
MIQYTEKIFSQLSFGINVPSLKAARLLAPPSEQMAELRRDFIGVEISPTEYLAHNVRFFTAKTNTQILYCFTNLTNEQIEFDALAQEGIAPTQPNEAVIMATIADASIARSSTTSLAQLEQEILFQQEDTAYKGHALSDLLPFFESMHFFVVHANSPHQGKETKDLAYLISSYDSSIINPNLHIFLSEFRNLLSHPGRFMKQNIFWAMTAAHYKHVFLELYRCIENIYSFPHAFALKNRMGLTLASYEIARHCADELGWKRKEESSLIKIFSLIPTPTLTPLITANICSLDGVHFTFSDPKEEEASKKALAKLIYKIRNQMVHQFEVDKEIQITAETWIDLIKLLIPIIDHIYTAHATELPN